MQTLSLALTHTHTHTEGNVVGETVECRTDITHALLLTSPPQNEQKYKNKHTLKNYNSFTNTKKGKE